jgi:anti-sigma factor RsiW
VNCREVSGFLLDFVDNELPADAVAEFQRHIEACANCHEYLDQYRRTIARGQALGQTVEPPIPDDLVKAVLDTISTLKK